VLSCCCSSNSSSKCPHDPNFTPRPKIKLFQYLSENKSILLFGRFLPQSAILPVF
jgi:hypothetical protein